MNKFEIYTLNIIFVFALLENNFCSTFTDEDFNKIKEKIYLEFPYLMYLKINRDINNYDNKFELALKEYYNENNNLIDQKIKFLQKFNLNIDINDMIYFSDIIVKHHKHISCSEINIRSGQRNELVYEEKVKLYRSLLILNFFIDDNQNFLDKYHKKIGACYFLQSNNKQSSLFKRRMEKNIKN